MASAAAASPCQQPSLLEETTNAAHNAQRLPPKALRRTQSCRALYRQLDSSESIPSFHESIWDADVVRSDEQHAENDPNSPGISPTTTTHPQANILSELSPGDLDYLSDLPVHTRAQESALSNNMPSQMPSSAMFRPTQLEPIVEQRSLASLRSSLCRTRLGQSPARNVAVVHQQRSHHSLHPSRQQKPPQTKALPSRSHRRRAFSLDDLDCFNLSSLDCRLKRTRSSKSSSSEPGSFTPAAEKRSQVAEPRRPSYPPPERAATPPGVPSFGSPEAINYFDPPQARSLWWRMDRATPRGSSPADASVAQRTLAANLSSSTPRAERPHRFGRGFSLFSNNFARRSSTESRRASLPAGVLRADDGTLVRGRFGGRVSGHGISSRGLESHPMQRAAARDGKVIHDTDGSIVPRQRERAQGQDREVMTGARGPDGVVHRTASFSSLLTTWLSRENQPPSPPQEQPQEQEPDIVDVTAGVDQFPGQNDATNQLRSASDPARSSTDTHGARSTGSIPKSRFWHCWRCFCIFCCEMTEKELDGCGWYGADRPWLREGRESVRLRRQQSRERQQRHASWDSLSELRRETGLRSGMRYRAGGSQG